MKKICYSVLAPVFVFAFILYSCSSENSAKLPTSSSYGALKQAALSSATQHFTFNTANGVGNFISTKGVGIEIAASSLTLNGNPVTGAVDIEYIEIFDGASMAATGKHTMGEKSDGTRAMLLSGGEFYINATQEGQQLGLNGFITLQIPTWLSDAETSGNPDMSLWELTANDSVWVEDTEMNPTGIDGVDLQEGQGPNGVFTTLYYTFVNDFGWTNVDCFYNDPRPKTPILATVPSGYDNTNSNVYLHYDGLGNGLATLDTYITATQQFSEHYGQIPIGLQCHVIFVTEENGQWRYAIKPATISANAVYSFIMAETTVGTEAQMKAAINALP